MNSIVETAKMVSVLENLSLKQKVLSRSSELLPSKLGELEHIVGEERDDVSSLVESIRAQEDSCNKVQTDIESLEVRQKEAGERLTSITNQREYQAALKEVEVIEGQLAQRKGQLTEDHERLEAMKTFLGTLNTRLEGHEKDFGERASKVETTLSSLQGDSDTLQKEIDDVLSKVPNEIQRSLNQLIVRDILPLTASALSNNVCSACRMSFPAQLIMTAVKENQLVQCPNCFRFLVPETTENK